MFYLVKHKESLSNRTISADNLTLQFLQESLQVYFLRALYNRVIPEDKRKSLAKYFCFICIYF